MKVKKFLSIALLVPGLMMLPGCDWFSSKESVPAAQDYKMGGKVSTTFSEVTVTIDGKPGITVEEFKRNFDALKQAQPMIDQMLPFMPEDQQRLLYSQIIENIVGGKLVHDYVSEQGWDKTVEYLENANRLHEDLDRELANREFQNRIVKSIEINDAELQNFYKKNRNTNMLFKRQPFMISADGVNAVAVKAKDEAQAKAIATAAKQNGDLKKAAQAHKQSAQDLGLVTAQSTEPDRLVVIKALGMERFPSVEIVKSDDVYWVVQGLSKKDAEFALFDQVKDAVKEVVMSDRFQKQYLDKIEGIKKQHDVVLNQDFINGLVVKAPTGQKNPMMAMAGAAQQGDK